MTTCVVGPRLTQAPEEIQQTSASSRTIDMKPRTALPPP
eukprot:CAMPEP_0185308270 /NCGR_PEP_ID=MMETSP1363-20130426/19201_1 /TAXON_ID=38817 /ORGANISM="Gephyrocapsa oceanica, Strain RCC1303" /LENGTH=38 /DNA_ID= /DNA_START= /DNA_END= /DNA_ORIENTATION=